MRDGVVLRADVYRPDADGKFPVLLQRTPYNKAGEFDFGLKAAARGYVVVVQDVRGRYTSEGEWYTFRHEPDDGYDTVEWAAALPDSNGKVGMFGGSYVGATQMLTAIAHPPHLAGIFPVVTASNYHENWTYQGGAFEQWFNESWTSGLAQDTLNRQVARNTNAMHNVWKLPLSDYPLFDAGAAAGSENPRSLAPYCIDWLMHPSYDDYWKRISIEEHFSQINVPVYSEAAWYDIFLGGSLQNYMGIKTRGASDTARREQRLLVVIGGHAGRGRHIGDVDFGPAAEQVDQEEVMLRWYDAILKGEKNGVDREKPVKIFVMGKNDWREEDDWPLARAQSTRYYLHSGGKANSLRGDGTLIQQGGTQTEPADHFVYDPADPVPTSGGPLCCDAGHLAPGPRDQRPVEVRDDVLVYTTPALKQDLEVTGPVSLELYASSSAVDTDFTAKLVDVWPNGFAQNLTEGILRARYRNSREKPEIINPGEVYKLTIDLWATSNVFLAGHELRLEVSSSNFPRFDRNPNTGESPEQAIRVTKATNTIYHDREHPSALVLPVVQLSSP
jgi:putative CocE/NonD family hydrolase